MRKRTVMIMICIKTRGIIRIWDYQLRNYQNICKDVETGSSTLWCGKTGNSSSQ